ncbi:hypothetical protein ACYPKM_00655 [Pseudomonas aeruginosa]
MNTQYALSTLPELFNEVETGKIAPASFIRHFAWSKADVEKMSASILNGMHLGNVILFEPGPEVDVSKLISYQLGAAPLNGWRPKLILMEGYCRLASFSWIHNWSGAARAASKQEHAVWLGDDVLMLDYDAKGLVFVPKAEQDKGLRLPTWTLTNQPLSLGEKRANSLIDSLKKSVWIDQPGEVIDEFITMYNRARVMMRNAAITVTTISGSSPEEAFLAYRTATSSGVTTTEPQYDWGKTWGATA